MKNFTRTQRFLLGLVLPFVLLLAALVFAIKRNERARDKLIAEIEAAGGVVGRDVLWDTRAGMTIELSHSDHPPLHVRLRRMVGVAARKLKLVDQAVVTTLYFGDISGEFPAHWSERFHLFPFLANVFADGQPQIDDEFIRKLLSGSDPYYVDITGSSITDESVAMLTASGSLDSLFVGRTAVTDACIPSLAALDSIWALGIEHSGITSNGIAQLQLADRTMRYLNVAGISLSRENLAQALQLGECYYLNFSGCGLGDTQVASLQPEAGTSELLLADNPLSDEALASFVNYNGLSWLDVARTGVGVKTVNALREVGSCVMLDVSDNPLGTECYQALSRFEVLRKLYLDGCEVPRDTLNASFWNWLDGLSLQRTSLGAQSGDDEKLIALVESGIFVDIRNTSVSAELETALIETMARKNAMLFSKSEGFEGRKETYYWNVVRP